MGRDQELHDTGDSAGEASSVDSAPATPAGMIRRLLSNRFLRYLVVGGINTAFGYGVFAALVLVGVHYAIAAATSTVAGVLFNFQTYGRLVFGRADRRLLFRFVLVYGLNYVIGVSLLRLGRELGIHVLVTSAVLILPMSGLAFLLNKLLVFEPSKRPTGAA